MEEITKQLANFLSIGIALSTEKDIFKLLDMILIEARRITNAEAGSLFLLEDNKLTYKIMHNQKMKLFVGRNGEKIELPPVPLRDSYVSSYSANHKIIVNIKDVYNSEGFDFSGPKEYDSITGYRTKSLLCVPLKKHDEEVIGVIQLINAIDPETKEIIEFQLEKQISIQSLSSLAATAINNAELVKEINVMIKGFVQLMITALESRTPYNATHTEKVTKVSYLIAKEINNEKSGIFKDVYYDKKDLDIIVFASWFHDIGKVVVPLEVMNKSTRFGQKFELLCEKLNYAIERTKNFYLEQQIELYKKGLQAEISVIEQEYNKRVEDIKAVKELIVKLNKNFKDLTREEKEKLEEIEAFTFPNSQGREEKLFDEYDIECVNIKKGTLTEKERKLMESHVLITEKMLSKIPLGKHYKKVAEIACMHHENPNGKGYPRGLKGNEIPLEASILRVADIFDALTATDRPYKAPTKIDKAINILIDMAKNGEIDKDVCDLFIRKRIWEKIDEVDLME